MSRTLLLIEKCVLVVAALFGFAVLGKPLGDNSFFTHLRTGMNILETGNVPSVDPYSFTAQGESWVVQSWLPSAVYGVLQRLGEVQALTLFHGLLGALTALIIARLAVTGNVVRTVGAVVLSLAVSGLIWPTRPVMFGVLCFAFLVYVVKQRLPWWTLIPVAYVWVNSHGSFVYGFAWFAAVIVGARIDNGAWNVEKLRYFGVFVLSVIVSGVVNPVGYKLLLFPLKAADNKDVFAYITEWQSPDFQSTIGLVALISIVLMIGVMASSKRLTWAAILPFTGLLAASLYSIRNLLFLSVVAAPMLAASLLIDTQQEESGLPKNIRLGFAGLLAAATVLVVLVSVQRAGLDLEPYPVAAVNWAEGEDLIGDGQKVVHSDRVGNYLTLRYGTESNVFIDDRYDMYPSDVAEDFIALVQGSENPEAILDGWDASGVLWEADKPLSTYLEASDNWSVVYDKEDWMFFVKN